LLEALVSGESARSGSRLFILIGWLIAIVAIAGPTWRLEPNPFADDASPLVILLKADASMDQPDPAPARIEHARLKIADLADARQGQPLGLVAYAGSAHLVLPPTRDTAIVASMAAEISRAIMPVPGDRLDLALREAVRVLTEGGQAGSILVMADSVGTDLYRLESLARELNFPIQFLSINGRDATPDDSLRAAARALKASVESLDIEGRDIATIVRRAANTPVARSGEQGGRWEEAGWWLVPLAGLAVLGLFRKEEESRSA